MKHSYTNEKKDDYVSVHAAIAEAIKAVECTVYEATKFQRFKTGKSLIIRNKMAL